jgi:hypothetical protein
MISSGELSAGGCESLTISVIPTFENIPSVASGVPGSDWSWLAIV